MLSSRVITGTGPCTPGEPPPGAATSINFPQLEKLARESSGAVAATLIVSRMASSPD